MASFNRVILVGNLTRDVELRYTSGQSGIAVTELGMAVNDRRKDGQGNWTEETTFVDITVWGRQAELCSEYLGKGSPLLIEGRLKLDTWEDRQSGERRSKLLVVGEKIQFLGQASGGGGQNRGGQNRGGQNRGGGQQRGGQNRGGNNQRGGYNQNQQRSQQQDPHNQDPGDYQGQYDQSGGQGYGQYDSDNPFG